MDTIGYINLKEAIRNNELKLFLTSNFKYSIKDKQGFDTMNDFYEIVLAINQYGEEHPEFINILKNAIMQILNENKLFYTYSIINIIKEQFYLESKSKNKIQFIDDMMLLEIKRQILMNKEQYETIFKYEGTLYKNGLMGSIENIDNYINSNSGKRIL